MDLFSFHLLSCCIDFLFGHQTNLVFYLMFSLYPYNMAPSSMNRFPGKQVFQGIFEYSIALLPSHNYLWETVWSSTLSQKKVCFKDCLYCFIILFCSFIILNSMILSLRPLTQFIICCRYKWPGGYLCRSREGTRLLTHNFKGIYVQSKVEAI